MARWYNYAVIRLPSHAARGEKLNVALVIFHKRLDVRIARRLDKVGAISGAIDGSIVREELTNLALLDEALSKIDAQPLARIAKLSMFSSFEFSDIAEFEAESAATYEQQVSRLSTLLVEPEPAPAQPARRKSRLFTTVKSELRKRRVLARRDDDITSHRVMLNWRLDEGLSADMVLRNGSMHVAETVDASSDEVSIKRVIQDVAVAALVLEKARMTFGDDDVKGRIVYHASLRVETFITPSLTTAEHQGAELVNWASAEDRSKFIDDLSSLANPLPRPQKHGSAPVNASTYARFDLN